MKSTGALQWIDGRWHCDEKPIHAGCGMQMRCPDGQWIDVRIESVHQGRNLFAYFTYHGIELCTRVDPHAQTPRTLCWEGQAVAYEKLIADAKRQVPQALRELGCSRFDFIRLHAADVVHRIGDVYVIGHPDEGSYEWALIREETLFCTNVGYGSAAAALRDGLIFAEGDEPQTKYRTYERTSGGWVKRQSEASHA